MAGQGFRWTIDLDAAALTARAGAAANAAAARAGEAIRLRALALAPRRSGALVASCRVEVEGGRARVSFSAPYARIQHDRADFRHPGGGGAGYLAGAVASPEAARALLDALKP